MNKTIGQRLKEKRNELNLTVEKISNELKIRPEFIKAIEKDDYSVFSSDIYAKGFIKSYCKYLGLDSENFTAVYRRDIESTKLKVKTERLSATNPDSDTKVYLNRHKFKYILVVIIGLLVTLGILSIVNKAFEPPALELINPTTTYAGGSASIDYYEKTVRLIGKTDSNTVVKINGMAVIPKSDNSFESELYPVTLDTNKFLIEAISNVGVVSRIELTLNKKANIIEDASGINGAVQIVKENALVKINIDGQETTNGVYFENDSIPIIGKTDITIETDKPDNIKIFLNGNEYKIIEQKLVLTLVDNKLEEK